MNRFAVPIWSTALLLLLTGASLGRQASSAASHPQVRETNIQLHRSDVLSEKKQIIAENMRLTDTKSGEGWPVHDAYTKEPTKLSDTDYALIKEYAQSCDTLTDAHADNLAERMAGVEFSRSIAAAMDSEILYGRPRKAALFAFPEC